MSEASVWVGVRAASLATGRVLGMLAAGAYFAEYKVKSQDVWRGVNLLCSDLLIPCLSVVSCAKAVSWETIHNLYVFPVLLFFNTMLPILIGYTLPYVSFGTLRISDSTLAVLSISFPNVVSLPVPVFLALFDELEWVRRGGLSTPVRSEDIKQQGMAYCYLYGSLSLLVLWSFGYDLLVKHKGARTAEKQKELAHAPPAHTTWRKLTSCAARVLTSPVVNPVTVSIVLGVIIGLTPPLRTMFVGSWLFEAMDYIGQTAPPLCVVCMGAGMVATSRSQMAREELGSVLSLDSMDTAGCGSSDGWSGTRKNDCSTEKPAVVGLAAPEHTSLTLKGVFLIAFVKLVVVNATCAGIAYALSAQGWMQGKTMVLIFLLIAMSPAANNVTVVAARAEVMEKEASQVAFCQQILCLITIPLSLIFHIYVLHEPPVQL
eukprot:Rhum_TRINITY_DN8459_c0_g2::Rhum_TRINITY_DN8459_c0_g2_i1::g.28019::m.28019